MWLTIALVYCLVCWCGGFLIMRSSPYQEALDALDGAAWRTRLAVAECAFVLLAPLHMPVLVFVWGRCFVRAILENRVLTRSMRTFRAYEFVKVNSLHLDKPIREQFELHTPPFLRLDFNLIGDYRLKPEPIEVHDRFFLSPDGETLASICALLDTGSVCFTSVLGDGTVVDTCSAENPDPESTFEAADHIWMTHLPDVSTEELYAHHQKTLQELCARRGTRVMRFQKEQFREVVTYDQRIYCRWRFRLGDMDHAPPAPDLSSLRVTPAVSAVAT
jgi:hypothetical protein